LIPKYSSNSFSQTGDLRCTLGPLGVKVLPPRAKRVTELENPNLAQSLQNDVVFCPLYEISDPSINRASPVYHVDIGRVSPGSSLIGIQRTADSRPVLLSGQKRQEDKPHSNVQFKQHH
jgi:hypothetical protein